MSQELVRVDRRQEVTVHRGEARRLQAQHRARLQELMSLLRRRMADISDGFYEIGEALAEIQNNQLFRAAGYTRFDDFLREEKLSSPTMAKQLIAVATLVPREHAVRLGSEKSYVLVRYQQHAPGHPPLKDVLTGKVEIDGVPATQLSTRAIREATREVRDDGARRKPAAEDDRHLADMMKLAMRKHGVQGAQVTSRKAPGGRWNVELTLNAAAAKRLLKVL